MKLLSLSPHFTAWHYPLGTFDNFQLLTFHFQLDNKDHLGNNRLSYTLDPETHQIKILEENHYYPFGLKHGNYNAIRKDVRYKEQAANKKEVKQVVPDAVKFKYLYNGKELQDELGLNVYDYGARVYDPAAPRFWQVDPLAEKYSFQSVYVYASNNPVLFIDNFGMFPSQLNYIESTVVNENGEIIDHKDDGDDNIYLNKRDKNNIIGKEKEGRDYKKGGFLFSDDLNPNAKLPKTFMVLSNMKIENQKYVYLTFWPAEFMEAGWLKMGSWLSKLKIFKFATRIKANNIKELKSLIKQLSKPGSELSLKELKQLEKLVKKFGGKLRYDLKPVKGKIRKPHVHVEGLGSSIENRHIWIKMD